MRYPASEKAEIIRLVEASHLPARRTLATLGIPRATFYRWYDRYRTGGIEALSDHRSRLDRVWNLTVVFDNGSGLKALKLARSLITDGKMVLHDFEQSRQQFAAGKLGIIFALPNSSRGFSELIGSRFRLMSTTYPVANLEKGLVPTGGNAMMVLSKDKAKQDAAWEYVKFAIDAEGQTIAVLATGYMPTNKASLAPEYLGKFYEENPNWYTSIRQIPRAAAWGG